MHVGQMGVELLEVVITPLCPGVTIGVFNNNVDHLLYR